MGETSEHPVDKLHAVIAELGDTVFGLIALCVSLDERVKKLEGNVGSGIQIVKH
jgi:hypothetical protein